MWCRTWRCRSLSSRLGASSRRGEPSALRAQRRRWWRRRSSVAVRSMDRRSANQARWSGVTPSQRARAARSSMAGTGQRRVPISVGPPSTPAPGAAGRWGPAGRTARRRPRTWPAPGAVGRPVGVGAHHDLGHVDDPAAPVGQGPLAAPAHGRRVPVAGQEGGGQGGGRARSCSARRTRSASAAGCVRQRPPTVPVVRAPGCIGVRGAGAALPDHCGHPGGAPERPIGARRRRRPARKGAAARPDVSGRRARRGTSAAGRGPTTPPPGPTPPGPGPGGRRR